MTDWITNALATFFISLAALFGGGDTFGAQPALTAFQGGTGTTSPSGILYGDETIRLKTVTIGSNLTFAGGTLSATASGGSGTVSTSTNETAGRLSYWTTTSGTPARLGEVATTTLTASSPLSLSNPVVKVGGSNSVLTIATTTNSLFSGTGGQILAYTNGTGYLPVSTSSINVGTASALFTNGGNCSAGSFPLGVDASGAVETCTDAWTEAENTSAAYAAQATTLTIAGTANQITSSAGAQSLAANRTWTLSLPNTVIFPIAFNSTYGTTTYASSTALTAGNLYAGTTFTLNGTTGNSWDDFCVAITGSAALCDGSDNTGSGGAGLATSTTIVDTYVIYGTSADDVGAEADFTYDDSLNLLTVGSGGAGSSTLAFGPDTSNQWLVGYDGDDKSFSISSSTSLGVTPALTIAKTGLAVTLAGSLTVSGTNIVFAGDTFDELVGDGLAVTSGDLIFDCSDVAGTGLSCSGEDLTVDLGTSIDISAESNLTASWPIILTDDTLSFGGLSTSTAPTIGQLPYWTGVNTLGSVATGTITNAGNLTFSSAIRSVIGGALTIAVDLTSNFAWTGSHDFGGATFLEIPNGTGPTANDPGEIAHDTSDNQLIIDDFVIPTTQKIWGVTVASTSPAFISAGLLAVPTQLDGYTITHIQCHVTSGTSKVVAVEDGAGNSSEDITCATTNTTDDGSITNATYTAAELSNIDFGATSGAVDTVTISVFGTWTRE